MKNKPKTRIVYSFWERESGPSVMITLLCVMNFILVPFFGESIYYKPFQTVVWMFILFTGIISLAKNPKQVFIISIIPVLSVLFRWLSIYYMSPIVVYSELILMVITSGILISMIFVKVFEHGPVTIHRLVGSVLVYMLLANLWTSLYIFLFEHIEGSFQLVHSTFQTESIHSLFLYFSYVTITTTGYGDILPVHPFARSLVQVEAIIGVLYPVILIGRLVSTVEIKK